MNFTVFLTYCVVAAFTPGPNNIMALTGSIKYGFGRAAVFCFGVFVGVVADMALCALATSYLYEQLPVIEQPMRWLGAAYIVYLAVMVYRDKGEKAGEEGGQGASSPAGFYTGVVMQVVNVKVILYGITTMSVFILPHYREPGVLALFVLLLSVICAAGPLSWAAFGSLFQSFYLSHRRPANILMALSLLYCATGIVR